MQTFISGIVCAIVLAWATGAVASDNSLDQVSAIILSGAGGATLTIDANTPITGNTTIKCTNADGCTLGIAAMAQIVDSVPNTGEYVYSVCTVVDQAAANPPCPTALTDVGQPALANSLQNLKISNGKHKVQTVVYYAQPFGGHDVLNLGSWQVNYTLYQGK